MHGQVQALAIGVAQAEVLASQYWFRCIDLLDDFAAGAEVDRYLVLRRHRDSFV